MRSAVKPGALPIVMPPAAAASEPDRKYPEISWAFTPRIEPGEYHAFSRSSAIYLDRQYKRWVCAVQFNILDDALIETVARLTWYLNMGNSEKPRAGRRGNYWAAWIKANDGPPKRNDRLSQRIFENRYALVRVADTAKTFRQEPTDEQSCYSVVRDVVRWVQIGAPR